MLPENTIAESYKINRRSESYDHFLCTLWRRNVSFCVAKYLVDHALNRKLTNIVDSLHCTSYFSRHTSKTCMLQCSKNSIKFWVVEYLSFLRFMPSNKAMQIVHDDGQFWKLVTFTLVLYNSIVHVCQNTVFQNYQTANNQSALLPM